MASSYYIGQHSLEATINFLEITDNKETLHYTVGILLVCGKLYWTSDLIYSTKLKERKRKHTDYKRLKRHNQLQCIKPLILI